MSILLIVKLVVYATNANIRRILPSIAQKYVKMTRIERIIEFLNQQPKDNFLRHALALEYSKIGEDLKARDLFLEILVDSPDYIGSYYHLAKCLERIQDRTGAIEWYEKGMAAAKLAKDNHAYNELQGAYEDLVY